MKNKKIKIKWLDAFMYGPGDKKSPTKMETTGILIKDTENFLIVKNQTTLKMPSKKAYPKDRKPTFYFIPKGMIKKIIEVD